MKNFYHWIFPLNKSFFLVERGSLFRLLKCPSHEDKNNGSFQNCSLKGSLRNQKWIFYDITSMTLQWQNHFHKILEPSYLNVKTAMRLSGEQMETSNHFYTEKRGGGVNKISLISRQQWEHTRKSNRTRRKEKSRLGSLLNLNSFPKTAMW